jgi:uncharacterized membrane protein (DUF373 family)
MEKINKIKSHFDLTGEDERDLKSFQPLIEAYADPCVRNLHKELLDMGDPFLSERLSAPLLYQHHRKWFMDLFSGTYDNKYCQNLVKIGMIHARMNIRPHYITVAINIIRNFMMDILIEIFEDRQDRVKFRKVFNKILSINLDIIINSYMDEELRQYSAAYRVKNALISFAERFSSGMNLILIFLLIILTLGIVGLFFYDVSSLINGNLSHGLISLLGTLLILWVMIELMNTEINHLKGGKFNISVFIGVALVSFIRDLMIAPFKHGTSETAYYLAAVILILGIVYWLIKKVEDK